MKNPWLETEPQIFDDNKIYENKAGISSASIAKLGKGDNITTDVLIKICEEMNCHLKDIMESIDEREKYND